MTQGAICATIGPQCKISNSAPHLACAMYNTSVFLCGIEAFGPPEGQGVSQERLATCQ